MDALEAAETAPPRFIVIGRILRPHGIRGEVLVEVITDFPERFEGLEVAYLGHDNWHAIPVRVRTRRWHRAGALLSFEGYPDRTAVEALRDLFIQIPIEEAKPLPEGSYYAHELIGLHVITTQGEALGRIRDVLFTAANDVYVVQTARGELLLPAIRDVIKEIDLAARRIRVELLPGLRE
ncbi:MAG: ribosome maturation factor RimM [Anaerolineae bacterium]|nr:ribosome maturation factor RimM [Anaerolineae bacterium]